ncbi:hypothetical protein TPHA_0H00650 [Tetrapisispora phaffii CBS 4417]|uniref:N-(5'-phosphoribosyl)anthranilate isomerase n=1 Tax=Tetrapisispora phaffii (strain ATCC 24235 / CBS 4417 / NBRC 1672 / NRRL Y-8282 / UCD 70-5) TaxID=1071381 RepID=G8BWX1_TETPH|nr:hypothetical protein TPHA_0H00650 [Tetrapisispora phaffii CBS 4417]CCE64275.1 hypothetical protein TPHA_0H00650 [Tetrapisispora phaffii CBS 4417]
MSSKIFDDVLANLPVVKTCGLSDVNSAQVAIDSGAALLGVICVPGRKRTVLKDVATEIANRVQESRNSGNSVYLVGVFRNQPKEEVLKIVEDYHLDIIQLHGDEDWKEYYDYIKKPVIKRVLFPRDNELVLDMNRNYMQSGHKENICLPLFDSEAGGTGELLNWSDISHWARSHDDDVRFLLAGGLNPSNVSQAVRLDGLIGVDVSGGTETDGKKDHEKIRSFIKNANT